MRSYDDPARMPAYGPVASAAAAYWAAYDAWKIARLEWEADPCEELSKALSVADGELAAAEVAHRATIPHNDDE